MDIYKFILASEDAASFLLKKIGLENLLNGLFLL